MKDFLRRSFRRMLKRSFRSVGIDVRWTDPRIPPPMPPVFDDPNDALCSIQGGKRAAFRCPIDAIGHSTGFNFSSGGWHPFVATLLEFAEDRASTYSDSLLRRYYDAWQPRNAREALAGFEMAPDTLSELPSRFFDVMPWIALSLTESRRYLDAWYREEYAELGANDFDVDLHGLKFYGPVDLRLGTLEYSRLINLYVSIRDEGYDRRSGDVTVQAIRRGGEIRYLSMGGGLHRLAVAAALGFETIPATFHRPFILDASDAAHWPRVRSGMWTRGEAIAYVDHLFDFDSKAWARERGLDYVHFISRSRSG